jgi:hypothetical protein
MSGSLAKDNDELAVNFSYLVTFFKGFSIPPRHAGSSPPLSLSDYYVDSPLFLFVFFYHVCFSV